ncbi:MAG TPA: protein kinase [Thermoanaerobaculia bacterium]|nr:protein kinase [Thermoanaerobaculia bacterium]
MPLVPGSRLGPYRIDAEIGAGGMGHVFRATDTRLDRAVAIKILPEHRWSDARLRQRFEREARALSSLSHPNLCALYDVGELPESGAPYLVMELLQGETLRERLESRLIGMRKALSWGAQIASGLSAAHQKGVVHRDLKPENIFITAGELVKILDFGLATKTESSDRTTTQLRTEPGMVMGTAHYMSPEQVRGTTLDARSDIFALGIVLFEMLTGRVPFHARSAVETMNSILVDDPPELAAIVPTIPEAVESLVRRCLEKDPAQRFASASDLAFALESAAKSLSTATPTPVPRRSSAPAPAPSGNRARLTLLGVFLLAVVAAALLARRPFERVPFEPPAMRMLTYSGRDSAPAASPDGRLLAYVSARDGTRRIWLKQLADATEVAVTRGPEDSAPRFAPDGAVLLFTRVENGAGALYRVAVVGGEPRKLVDNAFDGDWSPDGKRIAFIRYRVNRDRLSTLCIVPLGGGEVQEVAAVLSEELSAPRWSPDGKSIAVTLNPRGTSAGSLLVIDLESNERRTITRDGSHGLLSGSAWVNGGQALIYAELDALASTPLTRRRGSSVIIVHDLSSNRARVLLRNPHSAADTVDVVGAGRIVFSEDVTRHSLQEVALDGSGARWLSRGMSVDRQPSYARGGKSVVFASDRGGNVDLWEVMLDSGAVRHLTDSEAVDWDPHPTADGKSLFFSSNRGGHFEVWTSAIDGANPRQVTRDGVDAENPSLPASGDWVFYDSTNPKTDGLWRIPPGGGTAKLVVAGETIHPEVSADGEFVAYQRPEAGGSAAIDVVRVADGTVTPLVSGISGVFGVRARWIGTSHVVAFRALDERGRITLFAQDLAGGSRRKLIDLDAEPETYAISPDGKRAILSVIDEGSGLMMAEGVEGVGR